LTSLPMLKREAFRRSGGCCKLFCHGGNPAVKLSRSLPAVLAAEVPNLDDDWMHFIVTVEADAVNRFAADATNAFALASEATIPQASGTAARLSCFGTRSAWIKSPSLSRSPIIADGRHICAVAFSVAEARLSPKRLTQACAHNASTLTARRLSPPSSLHVPLDSD
jgi:hypothetical protein